MIYVLHTRKANAHPIGDPNWSHTYACDVSIDTVNFAEALAGSHIVEQRLE